MRLSRVLPCARAFAAAAAAIVFALCGLALAAGDARADATVDAATKSEVIEQVRSRLNQSYVFPDVGARMADALRDRSAKGEYEAITSAREFADKLTADLHAVSKDKHLWVAYSPKPAKQPQAPSQSAEARQEEARQRAARMNHGFWKVERLGGNIGYLDLRQFFDPELARDKAAAAMTLLADTDALLIDLRENGGGSASMVALLVSYLLEGEPRLINSAYFRPMNETVESWTLKDVAGERYIGKDVYVLTSSKTFSAAEEFAYDLKALKRAIVVGERSGGGANPNMIVQIAQQFEMSVPIGQVTNPITKTNWEGVGVAPDIAVPAHIALETAHLKAVKKCLAKATDEETKQTLREVIDATEKRIERIKEPESRRS